MGKILKETQVILTQVHKSHISDLNSVTTVLEERRKANSVKSVFSEYGKLLKERQKKLITIFQMHRQLLDSLNNKNIQSDHSSVPQSDNYSEKSKDISICKEACELSYLLTDKQELSCDKRSTLLDDSIYHKKKSDCIKLQEDLHEQNSLFGIEESVDWNEDNTITKDLNEDNNRYISNYMKINERQFDEEFKPVPEKSKPSVNSKRKYTEDNSYLPYCKQPSYTEVSVSTQFEKKNETLQKCSISAINSKENQNSINIMYLGSKVNGLNSNKVKLLSSDVNTTKNANTAIVEGSTTSKALSPDCLHCAPLVSTSSDSKQKCSRQDNLSNPVKSQPQNMRLPMESLLATQYTLADNEFGTDTVISSPTCTPGLVNTSIPVTSTYHKPALNIPQTLNTLSATSSPTLMDHSQSVIYATTTPCVEQPQQLRLPPELSCVRGCGSILVNNKSAILETSVKCLSTNKPTNCQNQKIIVASEASKQSTSTIQQVINILEYSLKYSEIPSCHLITGVKYKQVNYF